MQIDGFSLDSFSHPGLDLRYVVKGYRAYGPPNNLVSKEQNDSRLGANGVDIRASKEGTVASYDLPGAGNQIFGDNVLPDGNVNTLGNDKNRWATIYGTNGDFTGSMSAGVSSPGRSRAANATDYFVVPQAAITYTLPAAGDSAGRTLILYAFGGATTVNVASGSNDTIYAPDNFAQASTTTYALARYHRITFICDGINWISIAYL
ncbi:MAG: hypothetical protein EOO60_13080 [Hymenobacter sp.]|nr:MAG: hypothetical protein EOO60_13080 [Hymenobacter sp.]